MNIWSQILDTLSFSIFFLSQAFGGNLGLAIITISLVARLVILPISIKVGRRMREQQEILESIQPEIKKIQARYKNNPEKLNQEMMNLYRESGYKPFDPLTLLGSFIQLPAAAGLFGAIRQVLSTSSGAFLWIRNIAQPDIFLAFFVALLTYVSTRLSGSSSENAFSFTTLLPALITLVFAWRLAAGFGLYWMASTSVGIFQSLIIKRSRA